MKVSELYGSVTGNIDVLQKQLKNNHLDQLTIALQLESEQRRMRQLMDITLKDGDRDLTGKEVLQLTTEANA